jgi:hypothetical protein
MHLFGKIPAIFRMVQKIRNLPKQVTKPPNNPLQS